MSWSTDPELIQDARLHDSERTPNSFLCLLAHVISFEEIPTTDNSPMSLLPRITELTRERVAREFDDVGPEACVAEITNELQRDNPELLDMAAKCAADIGDTSKTMVGFGMFYRLLMAQALASDKRSLINPLPRVTMETRKTIIGEIDDKGPEAFTLDVIEDLEKNNPELMQMTHHFASQHRNYIGVMQGFALLYRSFIVQSIADRARLH